MVRFRDKIKDKIAKKPSSLLKDIKWRQENNYWLSNSQMVAITVLSEMKKRGVEPIELASKLNVSTQRVSKILKGLENFTFKTVGDIEKVLNISLMHIYIKKSETLSETNEEIKEQTIAVKVRVDLPFETFIKNIHVSKGTQHKKVTSKGDVINFNPYFNSEDKQPYSLAQG